MTLLDLSPDLEAYIDNRAGQTIEQIHKDLSLPYEDTISQLRQSINRLEEYYGNQSDN